MNLILEYCGGGSMDEYLRKNAPLTEHETRHWLQELGRNPYAPPFFFHVHFSLLFIFAIPASGLKFLRDKGIIHRDLKVICTFVNLQIAFRAFNNNNK